MFGFFIDAHRTAHGDDQVVVVPVGQVLHVWNENTVDQDPPLGEDLLVDGERVRVPVLERNRPQGVTVSQGPSVRAPDASGTARTSLVTDPPHISTATTRRCGV